MGVTSAGIRRPPRRRHSVKQILAAGFYALPPATRLRSFRGDPKLRKVDQVRHSTSAKSFRHATILPRRTIAEWTFRVVLQRSPWNSGLPCKAAKECSGKCRPYPDRLL